MQGTYTQKSLNFELCQCRRKSDPYPLSKLMPSTCKPYTMKAPIFYLITLMLCYTVMSQEGSPSSSPHTDSECPFVDFTCEPGLPTTSDTFSQSDVCEPIFDRAVAEAGTLIFSGERAVGFKCHNVYGLQTALLCFPPNLPTSDDYCFCDNSAYPRFKISEVHDIKFAQSASRVSEDEGTVTVCAVSGKLKEGFIPVTVTISTVSNTVKDGIDFVSINKELSFSQSNQTLCVDVTILKDGVNEVDETLLLSLTLKYPPFDIPLDTHTVTIVDSDIVGVGLEQEVHTEVVHERVGNVSICVIANVTLSGTRTASAILQTEDVTAQAGIDYIAAHEPIIFRINGDNRTCVNITIHDDRVMDEAYEVFLVRLTSTDTPVFTDRTVVIILDQDDQLYPYGSEVGDSMLRPGLVSSLSTSSPQLTLAPKFRFFSRDETAIYVNTNGVLSFNQPFHEPHPQPFPYNSLSMISPYWENFETARFGKIYYRSTTDPVLRSRARFHLQDIFSSAKNFYPSYLFIATWDNVPQFGIHTEGDTGLANTFQVVMATDGMKSYVLFIYVDIKWGEGGMGFNAGDGVRSFTLPGSLTDAALDAEYGSNVDITGLYAYRVDLPDIATPRVTLADCEEEGVTESEPVCTQREVIQIGFERDSYTVKEGDKSVTVCAEVMAGTTTVPVSVTLVTVDVKSAQGGKDYTKLRVELTFNKSTPRVCTVIDIIHDSLEEERESFLVILTTTQTRTVSLKPQLASVTIHDDTGDYAGVRIAILLTIVCSAITFAYFKGQENRSKPPHPPKLEEERKDSSQLHSQHQDPQPPQPFPPDEGRTDM